MLIPKINLPPIETKYKIIGLLGIMALIFGFYYDHFYKPHAKNVSQLESEVMTLEDTIKIIKTLEYSGVKDTSSILENIKKKKASIEKGINREENKLPQKSDFSSILEKITHLANQTGLEIKTLEPKDAAKKEQYESIPLELEINARYINLLNFLEQLKEISVYPESIQIKEKARPILTIRLNLSIIVR